MFLIERIRQIIKENVQLTDIAEAINSNKTASFTYDGGSSRIVEIKLIGNTKTGKSAIRGYQISGPTSTGNNMWKIFLIDKISNFNILNNDQQDRQKYNPTGDEEFSKIVLQQKPS